MTAWISSLSLATLAIVAAITAVLGWRRSALFREGYASLAIEFTQEQVWADESWTLLTLSARLRNTSRVLVDIESVQWQWGELTPGTAENNVLESSPEGDPRYGNILLEPQEEDVIAAEVWVRTPQDPQPAFAELMVHCVPDSRGVARSWSRSISFVLEVLNAQLS